MQTFGVHWLLLCADRKVRSITKILLLIPAAHLVRFVRALVSLGFAVLFAVGCANRSFLPRPLASRGNSSIAASRSDKIQAGVHNKCLDRLES